MSDEMQNQPVQPIPEGGEGSEENTMMSCTTCGKSMSGMNCSGCNKAPMNCTCSA